MNEKVKRSIDYYVRTIVVLGIISSVPIVYGVVRYYKDLFRMNQQIVHWDVAESVKNVTTTWMASNPELPTVQDKFSELEKVNPEVEVYLLDSKGEILSGSIDVGLLKAKTVSTSSIEAYLETEMPTRDTELFSVNPRNPERLEPVSAARVTLGDIEGFYLRSPCKRGKADTSR